MRSHPDSRRVALALTVAALLGSPVVAGDGDQDLGFGLNGVYGTNRYYFLREAARLPNQYLAIVGQLDTGNDPAVDWARMSDDGVATWDCGVGTRAACVR